MSHSSIEMEGPNQTQSNGHMLLVQVQSCLRLESLKRCFMTSLGSARKASWNRWFVIYCSVFLILLAVFCARSKSTYLENGEKD